MGWVLGIVWNHEIVCFLKIIPRYTQRFRYGYRRVRVCPAPKVRKTDSKASRCFDGIWIASRSPKAEANFILGQLPRFPHSSADSKWSVPSLVNLEVHTDMFPGYILAAAEHCTLKQKSVLPDYVSALQDWVLRAFAQEPLQKERCRFLPEPAALHRNGGSVLSPNNVRLSSDVLPTLTFLQIRREETSYLLERSDYQTFKMHWAPLKRK